MVCRVDGDRVDVPRNQRFDRADLCRGLVGHFNEEPIAERRRGCLSLRLHRIVETVRPSHERDRALRFCGATRGACDQPRCRRHRGYEGCHCCELLIHLGSSFRRLIRQATFTWGWSVAIVKRPSSSSAVTRALLGGSRSCSWYSSGGSSGSTSAGRRTVAKPRPSVQTSP